MQCKPFLTRVAKLVWSQSQYQSFNKFLESLLRLLLRQEDQTFWWLLPQLSIKELSNCLAYILDTFKVGKVGMNEESCKKACRSRKKVREERCTGRKIHFSHYFLQSTMCYLLLNLQIRKHGLLFLVLLTDSYLLTQDVFKRESKCGIRHNAHVCLVAHA